MKKTVLCTSSHPIDLDDGRTLGPGEWAENVEVDDSPHNAHLIEQSQARALDATPVPAPRESAPDPSSAVAGEGPTQPAPSRPETAAAALTEEPGGSA